MEAFGRDLKYRIGLVWIDLIHRFRLDLTHRLQLCLIHRVWLDPTHHFRLDSTHVFWLDFTQDFFDLIWLTFNVLIFNSSCTIHVTVKSRLRESHIFQGVFEIIQHWNCRKLHDSENLNWFWQEHSKLFEKSYKIKKEKDWSPPHPPPHPVPIFRLRKSWLSDWYYRRVVLAQGEKTAHWVNPWQIFIFHLQITYWPTL